MVSVTPAGLGTFLGAGGCQLRVACGKPFRTQNKYRDQLVSCKRETSELAVLSGYS